MRNDSATWTLILSIIAAALALAAALVPYFTDGEIRWSLVAAGVFLLAFGFGARNRISSSGGS
jgi:hypothetical protein